MDEVSVREYRFNGACALNSLGGFLWRKAFQRQALVEG
jgi:hypothetical protein